jgi:hypothetical protein
MYNKTELMEKILTSPTAQKMIDYVSPIYGNSYVGLWLFQAIGLILDKPVEYAEALMQETNPITSVLLLDLWEKHYALPKDSSLTTEQRQKRLEAKLMSRGPCNPERLAAAVSAAIGGIEVRIVENVAPNTFRVEIQEPIPSIVPVVAVLEKKKPAHLLYVIQTVHEIVGEDEVKAAVAMTHAETYTVEV